VLFPPFFLRLTSTFGRIFLRLKQTHLEYNPIDLVLEPYLFLVFLLAFCFCKENGPRAIWLIEFWCLMNNTIRELISFLVFMFVVHRMQDLLVLRN
jgi:hypothetical protein